jgi:predicted DCC family thiol-disulfide oxidoreductase YuxK
MLYTQNILLFDGECDFCNSLVKFIDRKDTSKKITFISIHSGEGKPLLNMLNLSVESINSAVYFSGNQHFMKSTAVLHVFKDLGGGWSLLYGFIIIPKFIRDSVYRLIARSRYKLSGKKLHNTL